MKIKKLLSMLLAVVITVVAIPYAKVSAYTDGDFEYSVSDAGYATITGYTGNGGSVVIPDIIGGYAVTSIGDSAFEGCSTIASITIPEGVKTINGSAFWDCSILTSITIPSTVTNFGYYVFSGCDNLTNVYISDISAWCSISYDTIQSSPLNYASNLYLNGELVKNIVLPDDVNIINAYSFMNCKQLESVTISENTEKIGFGAFDGCSSLTSVTIPDSVVSIGTHAFRNCSSLENIYLPQNITELGSAFIGCSRLKSITIPSGIKSISSNTFESCTSLTEITIPEGVTSVEDKSFYNCSALTSITIPSTVTNFGYYVFSGCDNLTNVYISDISAWCSISYDTIQSSPMYYATNLYLDGELIKELVLPDGITAIKNYAFRNCTHLESVVISENVTSIGTYAFSGCSSLTSITIPDSVVSIGNGAFDGCSMLNAIYGYTDSAAQTYAANNNITFVALDAVYSVTYDANGGVASPEVQNFAGGKSVVLSETIPCLEGYSFLGWSDSADSTEVIYNPGEEHTFNGNITLYAVWEALPNISYDANGGVAAPEGTTFAPGDTVTLSADVPTLAGHTFKGWALLPDAETPVYFPGGSYILKDSMVLYAVWEKVVIPGDFNDDGSVNNNDLTLFYKYMKGANIELK